LYRQIRRALLCGGIGGAGSLGGPLAAPGASGLNGTGSSGAGRGRSIGASGWEGDALGSAGGDALGTWGRATGSGSSAGVVPSALGGACSAP